MIIVATATHKTKNMFFFLVQTEQGDIFKITLTHDADMGMVRNNFPFFFTYIEDLKIH
jgi:splicing factor 3B subunit 3